MRALRHLMRLLCAGLVLAVTAPAWAADVYGPRVEYRAPHRVPLAFRALSHHSPAVLASDACWRGCTAHCGAHFQGCLRAVPQDVCYAHNNACELACLRHCRVAGGPFVNVTGW
jgi:hypothetical protein